EIELHLAECASCRRHVESLRAIRSQVRRSAPAIAPAALRRSILVELERAPLPASRRTGRRRVAIGAAAACVMGLTAVYLSQADALDSASGMSGAVAATPPAQEVEQKLLDEVVQWHRESLPIDVNGPDAQTVESWFLDKVDFPLRLPDCRKIDASLLGARLANVGPQRAALLTFEVKKSKLSVLVFRKHGVVPATSLRRPVDLRSRRGYSVAVVDGGDVAYSFVSSLPQKELQSIVGKAALRPVRF
ncbi:MAG: hypothetical protein RBU37_18515, partial [Myxococcota bacterium]|nr:hypothetical protein [Myxococcota bacterium]